MKKYKMIFLVCLLADPFFTCTNRYEKEMPSDFCFTVQSVTEKYDSKTGLFTRRYVNGDSTIHTRINSDLKKIYALFTQCDFLSFPIEFDCKEQEIQPSSGSTIIIYYKGRLRRSSLTFGCLYPTDQRLKAKKFEELQKGMWNIVRRQKAIKSMKNSNVIFL